MTIHSRLRALELATDAMRHEIADRCPVCGAAPEYGTVGHVLVLEGLPPERQGTALAEAYRREQTCPECDRLVDGEGWAIPGQGQGCKFVILSSPAESASRQEVAIYDHLLSGFWKRDHDEQGVVRWRKAGSSPGQYGPHPHPVLPTG